MFLPTGKKQNKTNKSLITLCFLKEKHSDNTKTGSDKPHSTFKMYTFDQSYLFEVLVNRLRHGKHWLTSLIHGLAATIWRKVNLALLCWYHQCWCFWAFPGGSCSLQPIRHERALLQCQPNTHGHTNTHRSVDQI